MHKVTLEIDGMMCGMCEAHINDVVRKNVSSATRISSSHRKGQCTFVCQQLPDKEKLAEAIAQTGYELKNITFEEQTKKKWSLFGK